MLTSLSLSLSAHTVSDCKSHVAGWCGAMPMQVPSSEPQHWDGSMFHLAHDVLDQCALTHHGVTTLWDLTMPEEQCTNVHFTSCNSCLTAHPASRGQHALCQFTQHVCTGQLASTNASTPNGWRQSIKVHRMEACAMLLHNAIYVSRMPASRDIKSFT